MPAVSVIVPVFDGEKYLRETLESALAQTFRDVEVIVVDDGSRDGTAAVIESFAGRVTALAQENQGLAAARNRGAAVARGRSLAFLDADDTWDPAFLERSLPVAAEAASFSGWKYVDAAGSEVARRGVLPTRAVGLADLALRNRFPPSAMLVASDLFRRVGGFDAATRPTEDWDFCLRVAALGVAFQPVAERLCRYRLHDRNMSRDADRLRAGFLSTLGKFYARDDLPPAVAACRERAIADCLMEISARFVAAGRHSEARRDFIAAVEHWRGVLDEDETYYAALCADQPLELKATAEQLDLDAACARVADFVRECAARGLLSPAALGAAQGRLQRVSALLAYGQGDGAATRRAAWRAVRSAPRLVADRALLAAFLKSFAGPARRILRRRRAMRERA